MDLQNKTPISTERKIELAGLKYRIVAKACIKHGIDSATFGKYVSINSQGGIDIEMPSASIGVPGLKDRIELEFKLFDERMDRAANRLIEVADLMCATR